MSTVSDFLNRLKRTGGSAPSGGAGYKGTANNMVNSANSAMQKVQGAIYPNGGISGSAWSGPSGSGGSGGSVLGASTDPEAEARVAAQNDIRNKFGALQSVFNSLFGEVDNIAREKTQQIDDVYNKGLDTAVSSFGKAQNATNNMYTARGLGDSSYRGVALDENNQVYNDDIANMGVQRSNNLADIGRYAEGTKAQLTASRDAYSPYMNQLDQYGLSDLMNLQSSIGSSLSGANQQAAGFGTNSEFVQKLGGITPVASNGTAQLATKLQNLLTSSAPSQAKKYIAMGLIKAGTLNDPSAQSYWTGYFDDLLRTNGLG